MPRAQAPRDAAPPLADAAVEVAEAIDAGPPEVAPCPDGDLSCIRIARNPDDADELDVTGLPAISSDGAWIAATWPPDELHHPMVTQLTLLLVATDETAEDRVEEHVVTLWEELYTAGGQLTARQVDARIAYANAALARHSWRRLIPLDFKCPREAEMDLSSCEDDMVFDDKPIVATLQKPKKLTVRYRGRRLEVSGAKKLDRTYPGWLADASLVDGCPDPTALGAAFVTPELDWLVVEIQVRSSCSAIEPHLKPEIELHAIALP
jgi:hypothetical protein